MKQGIRTIARLTLLGFAPDEIDTLRRISRTLSRWAELECGDGNDSASWGIERDETTGKPWMVTHPHKGDSWRRQIPDREEGALRRLAAIMATHEDILAYHQTDPRGSALYILKASDVAPNESLDSVYTRGIAV